MSGYCRKVLRVDLTAGNVKVEDLDIDLAKKFIGGRGLGTYYIKNEVPADVDALSPENKIVIATGPLTGSKAPTAARYMVVTKSPLSGTIASSNSGGFWGAELKNAGFDLIILEGKSPKPCYISIKDDKVEIKDAGKIWGKLVSETTDILLEEESEPKARVMTIGPAGTTRVIWYSCWSISSRAFFDRPASFSKSSLFTITFQPRMSLVSYPSLGVNLAEP